jgi:hypothetical protein
MEAANGTSHSKSLLQDSSSVLKSSLILMDRAQVDRSENNPVGHDAKHTGMGVKRREPAPHPIETCINALGKIERTVSYGRGGAQDGRAGLA